MCSFMIVSYNRSKIQKKNFHWFVMKLSCKKQIPVGGTSTSWWRNPASWTGLSPQFLSPKLLSNMTHPYCAMLTPLLSEYPWVLGLIFDWIIRIGTLRLRILQRRFDKNGSCFPNWLTEIYSTYNFVSSVPLRNCYAGSRQSLHEPAWVERGTVRVSCPRTQHSDHPDRSIRSPMC